MPLTISFIFNEEVTEVVDVITEGGTAAGTKQWSKVASAAMRHYFKLFDEENEARAAKRVKEFGI